MTDSDSSALQQPAQEVREWLDNNRRVSIVAGLVLVGLYWTGSLPSIPTWWPIAAVVIGAASVGGYVAGQRVIDLLPEPDGILLVEFDASDMGGGAIYELSEEAFEAMTVDGTLFSWDQSPRRVHEVREYDPDANHAVGNWRESMPASALAGERDIDDVLAEIEKLRSSLEPDVAEARMYKRYYYAILRAADKERAEAFNAVVGEHALPSLDDAQTLQEVAEDVLPEESHPTTPSVRSADDSDVEDGPATNGDSHDDGDAENVEAVVKVDPSDWPGLVDS